MLGTYDVIVRHVTVHFINTLKVKLSLSLKFGDYTFSLYSIVPKSVGLTIFEASIVIIEVFNTGLATA